MELPTALDPHTCVRKGLCPIIKLRGQQLFESHSLYYEQHGLGTKYKVLFLMGLNSTSFSWGPQVRHFGRSEDHTILVFDNRGVGNSGYPRGLYTTSEMAKDTIVLLDFLGWTEKRDVHVVGLSLGGMIAQELATKIPHRIASLTLAVTTSGGRPWDNFPPWNGVSALARLLVTQDVAKKAHIAMNMLFPASWLYAKAQGDPTGRTNYEIQTHEYRRRVDITTPQRFIGHISQMAAGLTHYCSPDRLRFVSRSIPKIIIITGDLDNLVLPQHSLKLKASIPEADLVQWSETGHGIHVQRAEDFNNLLETTFKEGLERSQHLLSI